MLAVQALMDAQAAAKRNPQCQAIQVSGGRCKSQASYVDAFTYGAAHFFCGVHRHWATPLLMHGAPMHRWVAEYIQPTDLDPCWWQALHDTFVEFSQRTEEARQRALSEAERLENIRDNTARTIARVKALLDTQEPQSAPAQLDKQAHKE